MEGALASGQQGPEEEDHGGEGGEGRGDAGGGGDVVVLEVRDLVRAVGDLRVRVGVLAVRVVLQHPRFLRGRVDVLPLGWPPSRRELDFPGQLFVLDHRHDLVLVGVPVESVNHVLGNATPVHFRVNGDQHRQVLLVCLLVLPARHIRGKGRDG